MSQNAMGKMILASGLIVITTSIVVMVTWILEFDTLKSLLPAQLMMRFNSSICMFLSGLAVLCLYYNLNNTKIRLLVFIITLVPAVISTVTLLEYLFQLDLNIDQLLIRDTGNVLNPGRMSLTVAFCFVTISFAILMLAQNYFTRIKKPIVAALCTTTIIVAGLLLVSFIPDMLFGARASYYANMGLHTSISFLLLGFSVFLINKIEGNFSWSLSYSITVNCIVWVISLLAISSIYFSFVNKIEEAESKLIKIQKTMNELSKISTNIVFYDNNEEYTSNPQQKLANKSGYVKSINKNLISIDELTSDNTIQKLELKRLKNLIYIKFESVVHNEPITLDILHVLNKMLSEEKHLFTQQEVKLRFISNQALVLSPLGILLSILIFCIGLFMINSSINFQKKLKARQEQLAEIVESSNDGIIGKDMNSIITSWNRGAEHIFGYSANEIIGKSMLTLIPSDRVHEELDIIDKIKQGVKIKHFETVRKRKDGKPIDVSVTISPIKNELNEITGASKIVRDITEKKQMELQLRQNQKMSAIGSLTGGIAHDFNNLLGIILGNLDLLERKLSGNEEATKRVKNALNAATRGAALTKRLLTFSRMQQLTPVQVSLDHCINNLVEMATRTIGSEIKITTQVEKDLPPIFIDATEFESTLLNLIVNSRDAMPNGGSIIISAKALVLDNNYLSVQAGEMNAGAYACVSVTDTGEGIPPEIVDRVFEPFFTTKPRGKGTGMGLAMIYGFIKQSGGIVKIYTEVGHGTKITMYLPFAANNKTEDKIITKPITNIQYNGTVLVVDDEIDLLEIASVYLKEMGFSVLHATDAISALEIVKQTPNIKLLVTDVIMPGGMGGLELAQKMRQLNNHIVIVYSSGFPAGNISKSGTLEIDALLINKPYNRETFVSTIHQAMSAEYQNRNI